MVRPYVLSACAALVWLIGSGSATAQAQISPSLFSQALDEAFSRAPSTLEQSTPPASRPARPTAIATAVSPERTDVLGAFGDSFKLLAIEHAIRVSFQEKTRSALKGPFWRDYRRSVRVPPQWEDSDRWPVNYVGHPIHGAAAGYSWLDHGPDGESELSLSPRYWSGRARAMAWSAAYSLQFEIGPLSEASIGNVGIRPETTGWVDYVVTPVGAFGLIVAEDALDRFFVKWVERHTTNRVWRASIRLLFNPARTLSNAAAGRAPWRRDGRPLDWR